MYCKKCGTELRRMSRDGFLQKRVYPLLGLFPWECPVCRTPVLLRKRYLRRKKSKLRDFSAMDAGIVKPSKTASSSAPAAKAR